MTRKAEWIKCSILTDILQPQVSLYSEREHCGHEDELTNHVNTAVNSSAPVRCLRMGAFCIVFCENHSPLRLLIWRFVHSLGEREKKHSAPMGYEGRREK